MRRKLITRTVKTGVACALSMLFVVSFGLYANATQEETDGMELVIPSQEYIEANGYPTNEKGETYGPKITRMDDRTEDPDLVLAEGEDDVQGYVKKTDLDGDLPSSPEEAVKYNETIKDRTIPLYLQDGETVVGYFRIETRGVIEE
jgi:hypothetical protein